MVEGIGVDVVEIQRMQRVVDAWGDIFLNKILTEKELAYVRSKKRRIQHIAGRFAVKEAVVKALATGWSGGLRWKDIEVENDIYGKPNVFGYGRMAEILGELRIHVSISHSENIVIAFAVAEKEG